MALPELEALTQYLLGKGWIDSSQKMIQASPAGEGNMNCTLRIADQNGNSWVIKQAKPFVEKYPQIPAPVERIESERVFYQEADELSHFHPRVIGFDSQSHILLMSDLGEVEDLSVVYRSHSIHDSLLKEIAGYLSRLHRIPSSFQNQKMRELNHEYIFNQPLQADTGIDSGLEEAASFLKQDRSYCEQVKSLGERYLENSQGILLHGDFYPGSLLQRGGEIFVLDPEFCFSGPKEFDLGVFIGHLVLARVPHKAVSLLLESYSLPIDRKLVFAFAGVEIMRRLIGVAQLPLQMSLQTKREVLEQSRNWVLRVKTP